MERIKQVREIMFSVILCLLFMPLALISVLIKFFNRSMYEQIRNRPQSELGSIFQLIEVILKLNAYEVLSRGFKLVIEQDKNEKKKYGILEYIVKIKIAELYRSLLIFQIGTIPLVVYFFDTKNKEATTFLIFCIICYFCFIAYINILNYRYKKGLYGTNESEAREIMGFMINNINDDIFGGPGGKKRFAIKEVAIDDLHEGIAILEGKYGR